MESSPTSPLQSSQAVFDYSQDASVESQDLHFLKASEHMKSLKKLKQPTSHRSHFKHKFLVEAAWRKGGVMTARHITPEQGGVVTSLHLTKKYIIVALDNSKIHVFNIKGDHQRTLSGHSGGVWAMVPWGDILVSGGCDREVRVWNMATG
jgi:F-box and WD-40 domain protein CDC4